MLTKAPFFFIINGNIVKHYI